MKLTSIEKDALEQMIDRNCLTTILEALTDICYGKAEHLRSNWQDKGGAKLWEKDAKTLDKIIGQINN